MSEKKADRARPEGWSDELLDEVVAWLEQAYPDEGCGLIVEGDGEWRFVQTENLADKYHAFDPEQFPRSARHFYIIDPRQFMKVEDRGERLVAIVHSHADVGDYFSEEDVRAATMPRQADDEPMEPSYPGVDYLVVSTRESGADHATLFRFDEQTESFPAVFTVAIEGGEYRFGDPA